MADTHLPAAPQEPLWTRVSECLATQMGLHYPKERWSDLKRGLAAAAPAFGMPSVQACAHWLLSAPLTRHQVEVLARHLTVGETYFFREKRTFEILQSHILPQLLHARAGTRRLRIWSAGCCTGEEPYSIAILLTRMIPDLRDWNISILATDIDPDFLRKAARGIYSNWSFRDIPPGIRERYFHKTQDGHFEVAPEIKAMVTFAYLNLAQDGWPSVANGTNAIDIIFCRNVLMYFESAHAKRVLRHLSRSLPEDGWLLVNPVEMPHGALPGLEPAHFPDMIVYRKSSPVHSEQRPLAGIDPVTNPVTNPLADPFPVTRAYAGLASAPTAKDLLAEPVPETAAAQALRPPPSTRTVHPPLRHALALYAQEHYADAIREAHQVLSTHPGDAAAMALLARTHANQGQLEQALAWCNKVVATDKLTSGWWHLLATILQELGQPDDAAAALRRALYLDPDNALAHFALGNLDRRRGKPDNAKRHFRNALTVLRAFSQEQVLPESEGMTAGRLVEIIQSTTASEAPS